MSWAKQDPNAVEGGKTLGARSIPFGEIPVWERRTRAAAAARVNGIRPLSGVTARGSRYCTWRYADPGSMAPSHLKSARALAREGAYQCCVLRTHHLPELPKAVIAAPTLPEAAPVSAGQPAELGSGCHSASGGSGPSEASGWLPGHPIGAGSATEAHHSPPGTSY